MTARIVMKVATTTSAESFFSLLKRGAYGSWHHVSREHLPNFSDGFAFRWNNRSLNDGGRPDGGCSIHSTQAVELPFFGLSKKTQNPMGKNGKRKHAFYLH